MTGIPHRESIQQLGPILTWIGLALVSVLLLFGGLWFMMTSVTAAENSRPNNGTEIHAVQFEDHRYLVFVQFNETGFRVLHDPSCPCTKE